MRIAVLSDVHSNLAALDAVLEAMPSVDEVWVLGDIVGYGPQPNEVIQRLQELGARSVLGNHDGAAIGAVDAGDFNPDARRAIAWTAEAIDPNARTYLGALPEVRCEGDLTAVHGSPRDPIWEYILSPELAHANLEAFDTRICLFGHTHVPIIYRSDARERMSPVAALPDDQIPLAGERLLINPGSVGQPRDGNPHASYVLLDDEPGTAEFRRVAYDVQLTQRMMRDAGLPARLAERLSYGR